MKIPENYQSVPSHIEGITVFAPAPEVQEREGPQIYLCPNCGASVAYDVTARGVACEYCGYTRTEVGLPVGRAAPEQEFNLDTWNEAEKGWGIIRKELFCSQCGAVISIPDVAITSTCPFCASNQVNIRTSTQAVLRPKFLMPFQINPEKSRNLSKSWLGKGWYHPKELSTQAFIDRIVGIYLPFWTFDSIINASWRAEVGYERQNKYFDSHRGEWKTRVEIDWRWESNRTELSIDDLTIIGSSHANKKILVKLLPFDMNNLANYDTDYLAGWQAHSFDIGLPDAWNEAKNIMRASAKEACYAQIKSPRVRNFSMVADFSEEKWRYVLLPVYMSSYRYMEKIYQMMVNGISGKVSGHKPVDWPKVWLVIAILFIPGLLIGLAGIPLILLGGIGIFPILLGISLVIIAAVIGFRIFQQAAESEPES